MSTIVVGVSDCKVSGETDSTLVTYALGSCIAVSIYDPRTRTGGLLHYMLPESSIDGVKARQNPFMFADSGIEALFQSIGQRGLNPRRCVVKLAGGARVLDSHGVFEIGKRNYLAAKKTLWKAGVLIAGEAVGGEVSRTVRLDLLSGRFWIREGGGVDVELTGSSKGGAAWRSAS